MIGLQNIGNTCYLNSAIQMLMNIPEYIEFIDKHKDKKIINQINNFNKQYLNNQKNLAPRFIKNKVSEKSKEFIGIRQNDSSEFLLVYFDLLDSIIKNNELNKLFGNKIKTIVKCKLIKCLNISETYETSMFLNLNIKGNTLDDCYRYFKSREKLDNDNMYYCDKCKDKRIASKRYELDYWNNNLIIILKRFDGFRKNNKNIEIPLEWRKGYKLIGGIVHYGGTGGGHYVYFGKKYNDYYLFNDSNVSKLSQKELFKLKNNSYVLHYRK